MYFCTNSDPIDKLMKNNKQNQAGGIDDARVLGRPKMIVLGLQHMFAMFGATVLVPILTGLSVSSTLLFAGLGTLLFHLITKGKVPAFLGSSFAFIGGYVAVKTMGENIGMSSELALCYACAGIACAGLIYVAIAMLIKTFGVQRVMAFFPPVVTGPIIISIGLVLSGSAITNCTQNWLVALVAIVLMIVCNIYGKGLIRLTPVIVGIAGSYLVAACIGIIDFSGVGQAAWIGFPFKDENTLLGIFHNFDGDFLLSAIIATMPLAFATVVEHIGDICAIQSTVGKNFLKDPGLTRTMMGDGLATMLSSIFGAPANTTYGENTGVLNITRVYDPRVVRIAAFFAILVSFCPKFTALIGCMPAATVGGISLILYGMISSVGIRNMVEAKVDFTEMRNIVVSALILVIAIGVKYGCDDDIAIGSIHLSGLAVAAIVGIALNAILKTKKIEDAVPM